MSREFRPATPGDTWLRSQIPTFALLPEDRWCDAHGMVRDEVGRCSACVIRKGRQS